VKLCAQANVRQQANQVLVGAADEVIESLYRMSLQTKRTGKTAECARSFQDSDVVPGSNKVESCREP
jgi:hypothetical protein